MLDEPRCQLSRAVVVEGDTAGPKCYLMLDEPRCQRLLCSRVEGDTAGPKLRTEKYVQGSLVDMAPARCASHQLPNQIHFHRDCPLKNNNHPKRINPVDYLPPNTTVNAARYCEVLTKLRAAIKRKRPGLLSQKVLLVHDNARPHAARTTQTLLENFKWEIFTHPPYSPDLASSDFHLFPALKLHLGGKHFANDDEVQAEANHWLRRQDTAWYNSGIKKWLQRC
ncbi:hypothetical protein LAZ67_21001515 [Cordylochernes scorpioides]|uniref:Transposase n=1 Tax=Cordylochernes scorpioides TaxID=51811 RepID=A0ABY6LN36_9ARAC|nr:hypothetical protein LAZ67_21001515 [Cordylochernes scorpioides]